MKKKKYVGLTYAGTIFMELLAIFLIVLKLCNVIKWSWLLVLIPIWIIIAVSIIIIVIMSIIWKIKE